MVYTRPDSLIKIPFLVHHFSLFTFFLLSSVCVCCSPLISIFMPLSILGAESQIQSSLYVIYIAKAHGHSHVPCIFYIVLSRCHYQDEVVTGWNRTARAPTHHTPHHHRTCRLFRKMDFPMTHRFASSSSSILRLLCAPAHIDGVCCVRLLCLYCV